MARVNISMRVVFHFRDDEFELPDALLKREVCAVAGSHSMLEFAPLVGTLPTNHKQLSSDMWYSVASFVEAFDLLALSQCSKTTRSASISPRVALSLLSRESHTRAFSFFRSLLVLTFMARQSRSLLCALITAAKSVIGSDYSLRHAFFGFLQLAKISTKFPHEPSLYNLAEDWDIPPSLAAAWLNDFATLRLLAKGGLEPNTVEWSMRSHTSLRCH